jgi:hypothetical protein
LGLDVTFDEGRGRLWQGKAALRPGCGKGGGDGGQKAVFAFHRLAAGIHQQFFISRQAAAHRVSAAGFDAPRLRWR